MSLIKNADIVTLNNGVQIPQVGFGTWKSEDGKGYEAVKIALANGYTHIDTAAIYKNEEEVGKAIKESGIPREKLFLTTKLWNTDQTRVEEALDESLKKLGTDYVDLYLIHWPTPLDAEGNPLGHSFVQTYKDLQKIYKNTKKIRAIGVSNFTIEDLDTLFADKEVDVVPVVNQIEAHPLLPQQDLFDYLKAKNIYVEAYCPLGSDGAPVAKHPTVVKVAEKLGVSAVHVLISWAIQRGSIVLPKSVREKYIISNRETLHLPQEDFDAINDITVHEKPQRLNNYGPKDFKDKF
ncbi:Aldo/keto reductase [Suhomyces tanzawaensis NRRL Y-17324]|uniref:2-dehydropantolactone reductase n=1 Tax=Suhomyces tanzawaensis NRRL Y-17324 TaxID=984487 RepID=A0A1E4SIQ1_9ASCO|nr:Aldo/keto reductase [Suhomyces tanzawaensis NRRL Y-17324]ODV79385.1 Aldo/keto reductase [Suhomyces tanzawaensis NRRL Y-17324]